MHTKLKPRVFVVVLAMILVGCLSLRTAHADSLVSPHYEIDLLGFFASDPTNTFPPPIITSGPTITSLASTSVIVQWQTDVISSSIVAFGTSNLYGTEIGQTEDRVKSHIVKVIGLIPNTLYHYQAKSADANGQFVRSTDQTFTTSRQAAISGVQVTNITLDAAFITWQTTTVTTSVVDYGTTPNYGSTVTDQSGSSTTNHTVHLTGLSSGTTYHFQIVGNNSLGQVSSDDYVFTTLALPTIVSYSLGTITGNTAEISWETNVPTDSFVIFWKKGDAESTAVTQGTVDLTKQHHLVLTGLQGQQSYLWRVVGRDGNGNTFRTDPPFEFVTPVDITPPVITDVKSEVSTSTKNDTLQLIVTWNTDEPAKSQIEYNQGPVTNGAYKLTSLNDTGLAVNHTLIVNGLKSSANYHFRIRATDAAGNTGYSSDYSILTPQKSKSLLEIILAKLEETFGWLRRVRIGG